MHCSIAAPDSPLLDRLFNSMLRPRKRKHQRFILLTIVRELKNHGCIFCEKGQCCRKHFHFMKYLTKAKIPGTAYMATIALLFIQGLEGIWFNHWCILLMRKQLAICMSFVVLYWMFILTVFTQFRCKLPFRRGNRFLNMNHVQIWSIFSLKFT